MELIDAYATVIEILETGGPLRDAELVRRLREAGLSEDEVHEVLDYPHELTVLLGDERIASLPSLLAPRMLTHRLSPAEAALDVVCVDVDWMAAMPILDGIGALADGTEVSTTPVEEVLGTLRERGRDATTELASLELLLLPTGYLSAVGAVAKGLLALRFSTEGPALVPIAEAEVGDDGALAGAVASALGFEPIDADQLVWDLVAADDALLTSPQPPLSMILDEIGAARFGSQVAAPGVDIEGWHRARRAEGIARRHGLSQDEAADVVILLEHHDLLSYLLNIAFDHPDHDSDLEDRAEPDDQAGPIEIDEAWEGDVEDDEVIDEVGAAGLAAHRAAVEAAAAVLARPPAAEALLGESAGIGTDGLPVLGALAEALEQRAPRPARASLRWLRAKAHERLGRALEAEAELRAAVALDPDHPLALADLGRFVSDRGDADHAIRLLRRAGVPADDDLLGVLEAHRPKAPANVGRNDPCWCGSGSKRKQCHRDSGPSLPLERRTTWMLAKTAQFLQEGPRRELLLELALARSEHLPEGAVLGALGEPLVHDVALVEGDVYLDFLAERGPLLPDEERSAFEQWALVDRSLFDVEEVRSGDGLVLRDVRTGDRLAVTERTASRSLRSGDLICTRVVPVGPELQLVGGVEPVALGQREALIELLDHREPVELIEFLSARFAPPRIQNTEGEDLVECKVSVRVPDPAGLAGGLDERFDRHDDGSSRWTENVITMGMPRVRSELTFEGDVVTITANSDERADRMLALLLELAPGAEVLADERTPLGRDLDEIVASAPPYTADTERLDPDDPMVREVLREQLRQFEEAWVDESIPALGGVTPRQAASDPTRRADLIRLLATFPEVPPGAVGMDPDRLRRLLDL